MDVSRKYLIDCVAQRKVSESDDASGDGRCAGRFARVKLGHFVPAAATVP